ncbi:hypothetical protein BOTBODRAFT_618003, partial [Botryobasidium botryosum FD-172 SS1]
THWQIGVEGARTFDLRLYLGPHFFCQRAALSVSRHIHSAPTRQMKKLEAGDVGSEVETRGEAYSFIHGTTSAYSNVRLWRLQATPSATGTFSRSQLGRSNKRSSSRRRHSRPQAQFLSTRTRPSPRSRTRKWEHSTSNIYPTPNTFRSDSALDLIAMDRIGNPTRFRPISHDISLARPDSRAQPQEAHCTYVRA